MVSQAAAQATPRKAAFASVPTIDVLVVVDVQGALATGDLNSNLYMIDTSGSFGSGREGTNELITKVGNGQEIVWQVATVDPSTAASIIAFSGQAVGSGPQFQINPQQLPPTWGSPWQATTSIPAGTSGTQYQYSMTLQFGGPTGTKMTFDPFLLSNT